MFARRKTLIALASFVGLAPTTASLAGAPPSLPLRWSTLEPMPLPVFDAGAGLSDGWIVVSGGFGEDLSTTPAIQVHSDSRGWRPVGTQLVEARARHTQITLSDGRVLVVGGVQGSLGPNSATKPVPLASAEVFHPLIAGSELIDLGEPLVGHTAHLLPDGRVAVVGGSWVRLFDPTVNGFTEAIHLQHPRHGHAGVLWNRVVFPEPVSPALAVGARDEPGYKIVEQELSIDHVPTARGASIGATMEPQKVPVPEVREAPSLATRLVLLVVGGEGDSTIEEVSLPTRSSRLWDAQLPTSLTSACATPASNQHVLLIGGIDPDTGDSLGTTWWLDAHESVNPGPDLDLPEGCAAAACFVDSRDGREVMFGGEQHATESIRPVASGRMILRDGERVFSLPVARACAEYTRRNWFRLDDRRVAAVGGYRFVDAAAATADNPAGVYVRGVIDVVGLPSPLGGD